MEIIRTVVVSDTELYNTLNSFDESLIDSNFGITKYPIEDCQEAHNAYYFKASSCFYRQMKKVDYLLETSQAKLKDAVNRFIEIWNTDTEADYFIITK